MHLSLNCRSVVEYWVCIYNYVCLIGGFGLAGAEPARNVRKQRWLQRETGRVSSYYPDTLMHMHVDTDTLKSEDMYSHFRAYERIKQAKAHNG